METDNGYKVVLRSYGEPTDNVGITALTSTVCINCQHYSTFKAIVDAVMPILEEEEKGVSDERK